MPKQLSQNLKALLQDIGEASVLLHLSILLRDHPEWRAFRNYADDGCDLVLIRTLGNKPRQQFNVEVKTRQSKVTGRKRVNTMHFTLSAKEYVACHFVIAYWFDRNDYFILPKSELKKVKSNDKILYKFYATYSTDSNAYNVAHGKHVNNWARILNAIADPCELGPASV